MPGGQSGWRRSFEALVFGSNVTCLMFVLIAVPLCAWLYGHGTRDAFDFSMACIPFALGAILLILLCGLVPSLVEGVTLAFPLNLTLPTLLCSLSYFSARLLAGARPPVATIGEEPRLDQLAARIDLLGFAWLVLATALTLALRVARKDR